MSGDNKPLRGTLRLASIAALFGVLAAPEAYAGDAKHGEAVFKACAACHTDRPNASRSRRRSRCNQT